MSKIDLSLKRTPKLLKEIKGIHDVYIVFESKDVILKEWHAE